MLSVLDYEAAASDEEGESEFYGNIENYPDVPLPRLDENGLPYPEEEGEDINDNGKGEENGSFASDFYRCGTDWSSLLSSDIDAAASGKKLKQKSLFQIWGLKKDDNKCLPGPFEGINKKRKISNLGSPQDLSPAHPAKSKLRKSDIFGSDNRPRRPCPFYKKIEGTSFTVDAFRYGKIEGCSAYFLTHFHADHYGGLSKGWSHGLIYCTPLTAGLLQLSLSINPSFIRNLELDREYLIDGIRVTLLEANHCPGAALIHFLLPSGQCHLHTGDFRACKSMQAYPLLANPQVNVLYLDTTYCNPKYRFPSKDDVLSFVVKVTKDHLRKQPKTLIVVGAYSIGKECVYLAISQALGVKVYATSPRRRILQSYGWSELSGNLSSNGKDTPLHILPISHLRLESLKDYWNTYKDRFTAVLAFRPTGWTYSEKIGNQLDLIKPNSRGNITVYGVPYSEHSSFTELEEFVQFLRPKKIIPTVNIGNATNRDKMQSHFREWLKG